jgi:hypothetical protein
MSPAESPAVSVQRPDAHSLRIKNGRPDPKPTPAGNINSTPHLSPDGTAIVLRMINPPGLFVRRLDVMDWVKVPGSERIANEPFWHGSSRLTVPVTAGPTRELLDVLLPDGAPTTVMTLSGNARGGGWTANGQVVLGGRLLSPGPDRAAVPITGEDADRLLYRTSSPAPRISSRGDRRRTARARSASARSPAARSRT